MKSLSAIIRRTHYGALASTLIVASLAAAVFAGVIADRTAVRIDLTATRQYSLSERTTRMLAELDEPIDIVVSVSGARVSRADFRRVMDVLEEFEARSPPISVRAIDTASAGAAGELSAIVERLASLQTAEVQRHRDALRTATGEARSAAEHLDAAAELVEALGIEAGGTAARTNPEQARTVRATAEAIREGIEQADRSIDALVAGVAMPQLDRALAAVAPVDAAAGTRRGSWGDGLQIASALATQAERQRRFFEASGEARAAEIAGELRDVAQSAGNDLAAAIDRLTRLGSLEPLQLARALERTDAVLVVSAQGSTAIRFESLFPSAGGGDATAAQARFAGEELLSIAVATVVAEEPPILVITHAESRPLLTEGGRPAHPLSAAMARLIDRVRVRRHEVTEWAVALDERRPDLSSLDPSGGRPGVWFCPGSPSLRGLSQGGGSSLADREQRVSALGDALGELLAAGESVLVSLDPSTAPSVGSDDPLAAPLAELGIRVETGRPLITRLPRPNRDAFTAYQQASPPPASGGPLSPIAEPLSGVTTLMHWPMPIRVDGAVAENAGVRVDPILEVGAGPNTWAESRWLSTQMRWANEDRPLAPLVTASPPSPDADRDDLAGPWTIAVSAEQSSDGAAGGGLMQRRQRLVVVAATGWYKDALAERLDIIDGRRVFAFPGNAELFDASLAYLSRNDALIAGSPRAGDIPRIDPAASPASLEALRWILRFGPPAGVLLIGLAVFLVRR